MHANLHRGIDHSKPPKSRLTGHRSRHVATLSNIPLLGRTALVSRFQQVATEAAQTSNFPKLLAFLQFWKWIFPYLQDLVHSNAPYRTYSPGDGIFTAPPTSGPLKIAIAADWGTGTLEAETVAENMKMSDPHFTVHLGDVYYMGEDPEVRENCLGKRRDNFTGVCWPPGSGGSFALMGNHEMYSGGQAYFDEFLPTLGLLNRGAVTQAQSASYFCLETDHWIILGLDTGYHSGGVPALTSIPVVNNIPSLNVNARFDDKMLDWLNSTIDQLKPRILQKSVLLLTHHQPMSSFEHAFTKPAEQLKQSLKQQGIPDSKEFVWLYGHEHRLTIYKKQTIVDSLRVYPRCIGHGGMPVELTALNEPDPKILFYDPRKHQIDNQDPDTFVGYNGHVVLIFDDEKLTIEYHDITDNNILLTETFTPDGTGGFQQSHTLPASSGLVSGRQTS